MGGELRARIALLPDLSAHTAEQLIGRVRRSKRAGDIAVASIHWGSNWGYEIAPVQVEFAHQLVRGGIDIVHGRSSHHVRPIEVYQGKLILYGCGDLVTDYEGIGGHDAWRGDLGAMYFATVSSRSGVLVSLLIAPFQPQQMRLTRPSAADRIWLTATLNRINSRRLERRRARFA